MIPQYRNRRLFCLIVVVLFGFTTSHYAEDKPLKVFVMAGQSNMVGKRAKVKDLPGELQSEQKNALFFNGEDWIPLAPGKTEEKGFGPEISFAKQMSAALGETIGIIKHSKGGTSLAAAWSTTGRRSHYAMLRDKVKAAQKKRPIMVVGMLWVQGGADAKKESCANAYSKNLAALIAAARKDFGNPKMFFVVAQTHMHLDERKEKFSFLSAVRKAQASCRAENYGFVVCDDLERGPDKIHFNTRGLVGLGKLLAEKMGALVKGK